MRERKRLNSSKIRSAGYDPKTQLREVEFSDGKVLAFRGVSPEVHRQFMAAPPQPVSSRTRSTRVIPRRA